MTLKNQGSHNLTSDFAVTGNEQALTDPQRTRLAELRADLATPDGVRLAMIERAARMVLIAEWGEAWLHDKAEREGSISAFESKMLQRFFTAQAEARRALEALSRMHGRGDGGVPDYERILETIEKWKRDEQG